MFKLVVKEDRNLRRPNTSDICGADGGRRVTSRRRSISDLSSSNLFDCESEVAALDIVSTVPVVQDLVDGFCEFGNL